MLSVEDWAEIRRLRRSERLPISEIARVLKISRNTVKSALASDGPPKYQRAAKGSVADEAEPRIRELLAAYPRMPATVIAERIGWWYSIRTLSGRVRELRPLYLPPDPRRATYVAGEIGQCDFWFPDVVVPVGYGQVRTATALPVLTMVCGYSRWASALLIPTRTAEDLYAGWWQHLSTLGAVPRVPRDHYVRLDGNDYSVHPVAIGRRIEITADLSRVRVWCGGTLVADHDRIWAKHQTISDPEHVVAAKLLRRKRFDIVGPPHHVEVEQRLLTTYDTVLGLDGPVA